MTEAALVNRRSPADAGGVASVADALGPQAAREKLWRPRLSVVVPCFNEQAGLAELYRRVCAACSAVAAGDFELVLVNDGSRDQSWAVMCGLAARDGRVVAIDLSRNFGHQTALTAGLSLCRGERCLILDADLQDPPELLAAMMARMDEGFDVVYGKRLSRDGENLFKTATASLFYRVLAQLSDVTIPLDTGDFRLMNRRAIDVLNAMPEQHRFIRGMVSWMGLRQAEFTYHRAPRLSGTTKYPLSKMLRFAVDAVTGFSIRPLRIASYLGFACSLGTGLLIVYVLISYVAGNTVSGWASLSVIILAFASIQFIVLGIMGEYVGRLYVESKRRPLFVIQEVRTGDHHPPVPGEANDG